MRFEERDLRLVVAGARELGPLPKQLGERSGVAAGKVVRAVVG
jgi:hypothetical protein